MDFLTRIVEHKKQEVKAARQRRPLSALQQPAETAQRRSLWRRLARPGRDGVNIIAEIKRASPSKGVIRGDLDAAAYARAYEQGGAAAVSVLTDRTFFHGSLADLRTARRSTSLPVLRKDFIVSDYQIREAAHAGADAVLLIVRILSPGQLKDYLALCRELGLEALVEIHSREDLAGAARAGARLIGINNRDLSSFATNRDTAPGLAAELDPHQVAVAASGIRGRSDVEQGVAAGVFNFLVGESIVRSPDPAAFLRRLCGRAD